MLDACLPQTARAIELYAMLDGNPLYLNLQRIADDLWAEGEKSHEVANAIAALTGSLPANWLNDIGEWSTGFCLNCRTQVRLDGSCRCGAGDR